MTGHESENEMIGAIQDFVYKKVLDRSSKIHRVDPNPIHVR